MVKIVIPAKKKSGKRLEVTNCVFKIEKLLLQNFKNGTYTLSAYLIAQLGKNFADVLLFIALVALLTALVA